MAKLTRRGFLEQTSLGVATAGVLTAVPVLAADSANLGVAETELPPTELTEALVAHVRDVTTGEVSLMVGTREIIYHDSELVMRLLKAAR